MSKTEKLIELAQEVRAMLCDMEEENSKRLKEIDEKIEKYEEGNRKRRFEAE